MNHPQRTTILFLLAWSARMALAPMAIHWGVIGSALIMGLPMSWPAQFTLFITVVLGIAGGSILVLALRHPDVQGRMRGGVASMFGHSLLVLFSAAASNVGGVVLLIRGESSAAGWAIGLSTFVMLCEVAFLIGSVFGDKAEPLPRNDR